MKKEKILIVVICILVVFVLTLGGILFFKTDNTDESDNSIGGNEINENIISIATESDDKIYALTESGNAIELMDISEYNGGVVYTYSNNKLYLYLYKYKVKDYNTLGYIDLTAKDLSFTKLDDVEVDGSPKSIAVVDNIIYFSSSGYEDGIYKYNIDTKEFTTSNEFNEAAGIKLYTVSNSKMAYSTGSTIGTSPTVGIIDIKTGSKKEVSSNGNIEYIYNGKIIYREYDTTDNYSKWKYYEYNVDDDTFRQISDSVSSILGIYLSFIIPVDDYYVYVNDNTLNKYLDGKNDILYEFDGSINNITLVSSTTLNVRYGAGIDTLGKSANFNLSSLKFDENQNDLYYSQVIYLK